MYTTEVKRRATYAPDEYFYSKEALHIQALQDHQLVTARSEPRFIGADIMPPGNANVARLLSPKGGLTREGLLSLDDKEFVWPYLDAQCPKHPMFTELAIGKQWERLWMNHYYQRDGKAPPLEVGGHTESSFALVYARYLKQLGRGGTGTKLGRWLDAWLERAEAEEKRLAP